jgi:formyl-CoA transferase
MTERDQPGNPLVNSYKTKDSRWLYLVCLQADRFWAELCTLLGCTELIGDPRFANAAVRYEHRTDCVEALDEVFGARTLDEVKTDLAGFTGVWAPALSFTEVHEHPQVHANGFLPEVEASGTLVRLVAAPMHFDGTPTAPRSAAPELGQHTEEVLLDAGLDWDEISAYRDKGALG